MANKPGPNPPYHEATITAGKRVRNGRLNSHSGVSKATNDHSQNRHNCSKTVAEGLALSSNHDASFLSSAFGERTKTTTMPVVLTKIISGGQTGADMGALVGARECGLECGGFAPKDWLTENGPQEALLRSFGLIECEEDGYPGRTRRNVAHSDGTLLVGRYETGGSLLTYEVAQQLKKPIFLVPHPNPPDTTPDSLRVDEFRYWLERYEIRTLNVAGSRESENPGIAEFTRSFLVNALGQKTT